MSEHEPKRRNEEMLPVNINQDGTGRYEMGERIAADDLVKVHSIEGGSTFSAEIPEPSPAVHVTVEQPRSGKFMRRAKIAGAFGLAGAVGAAGIQVKQWFDNMGNPFSPKSSHSVEMTIEAPETQVYEDVFLNLARMESTFGVTLDTSLDRGGLLAFSNCDTQTRHTGKEGEDAKITASTNVGIIVESLAVTRDGDEIAAEIGGNITMTDASVDYSETMINVRGATGGLDVCRGTNEITKARHMVDVAIQQGTKVAASCALQGDTGKQVFESGIRSFIAKTELASGLTAEELERMDVAIDGYSVSADAMYGNSVREFRETLDEVIRNYLQETDDHKDPVINDRDLLTCEKHDIELAAGSSAQS